LGDGQGYVLVSTNYRLLPAARPLEQAGDVARALALVQKQAPQWGADPKRLVLMGHSAGAHLAMLLHASPDMAAKAGAQRWRVYGQPGQRGHG
jgi:arylformamidase